MRKRRCDQINLVRCSLEFPLFQRHCPLRCTRRYSPRGVAISAVIGAAAAMISANKNKPLFGGKVLALA